MFSRYDFGKNASPNIVVLYDTGRLPIWFQLPCLLFAFLCLWLAIHLLAHDLLGVDLIPGETTGGGILGILGLLFLSLWFSQIWLGRKQIVLEPDKQLVIADRWHFGICRTRIALSNIVSIRVRHGRLKATTFWDIYACDLTGKTRWLTRTYSEEHGNEVGRKIAEAIDRPLEK